MTLAKNRYTRTYHTSDGSRLVHFVPYVSAAGNHELRLRRVCITHVDEHARIIGLEQIV